MPDINFLYFLTDNINVSDNDKRWLKVFKDVGQFLHKYDLDEQQLLHKLEKYRKN